MRKIALVTAAALTLSIGAVWAAQGQPSPDTQQQAHPDASPQSHQPETKTGQNSAAQSPDQQQDNAASDTGTANKKTDKHRHKNNARQAKGTPKTTATSTEK